MTNFDNNESKAVFGYDTLNQVIDEGIKAGKLKPLFKNLWFEQELTMLFGVTNVGKSILGIQIAEEIARNGEKVIYFDYEMTMRQLSKRYCNEDFTRRYQFSDNLIRPNLEYDKNLQFKQRNKRLHTRMEEAVNVYGIKVFIVDNITSLNNKLSNGDQAAKFMLEFKNKVNKLGVSVLLIGHTPKELSNNRILTLDRLAGSKNISNFLDACFGVGKVKDDNEANSVYIKQLKARSCPITLNENRVLVCTLKKRKDGFLGYEEVGFDVEKNLLKGNVDITPQKEQAYLYYSQNKSYRKTAEMIGVSDKTVKAWIQDYVAYHNVKTDNLLENKEINQSNDEDKD